MRVLIVGGGVGGLTTALALHACGIEAVVCEQAPEVKQLGVGINTLPHAIKELAKLGLLDALDAVGIRTSTLIYKTARGQNILSQARGLNAGYDVPQFSIHRGKLQKVLHDAAVERLGKDHIKTGHRLTSFEQNDKGVSARFETSDGEVTLSGDVLIGADGIHSSVRQHYHGDEGAPSWNGILMWRGAAMWPRFADGKTMIIAGGMKAKLVLYPIFNDPNVPGKTLMNWVVCAKFGNGSTPIPSREDWSKAGNLDEVMQHVDGVFDLPEVDIEGLIKATEQNFIYPMCDRDPLEKWTDRRVTLLGDAAHPMYPVGSNGASQAILDAVCLADLLTKLDGPEALTAYEAERRPATTEIVHANRKGGPERVIDMIEERAPDGFDNLDDVATPEELTALVGAYQQMAGFTQDQVNR